LWDNHGVATDVCGTGGVRKGADMLTHQYCTPSFDKAFPALLEDLESRGLLDETLVVVAGEFGRTPKLNATAGRDHWPNCYTQLMAGGGVRGGQIYGESDRIGAYVKDKPVSPEDFHATVLHAFGVDSQTADSCDRRRTHSGSLFLIFISPDIDSGLIHQAQRQAPGHPALSPHPAPEKAVA
jgi:uncharacterized protein (DUF1501 family)